MRLFVAALALAGCAIDTDMTDVEQHVAQPRILLPVSGTGQHATVISGEYAPLDVALYELDSTPVSGATITFTAPENGARFVEAGVTETDGEGRAAMRPYPGSRAGAFTAWAHADGADPMPFLLTNHAGAPALVRLVDGGNQYARPGQMFPAPLAIAVTDSYENPVAGVVVDFVAPVDGASARMMERGHTLTDAAGIASTFAVAGPIPGAYEVRAQTIAGASSFALANVDPRASRSHVGFVRRAALDVTP